MTNRSPEFPTLIGRPAAAGRRTRWRLGCSFCGPLHDVDRRADVADAAEAHFEAAHAGLGRLIVLNGDGAPTRRAS